ncbi:MAG: TIGR02099 family protein [Burkholderiaceae bacterium]|nr:TIGR02099 family protein [Burkholderiaceae bacterium]
MSSPPPPNPSVAARAATARSRSASGPLRWLAWSALGAIVLVALSWLAIRDYAWPNLDRWRPAIERLVADGIGRPVQLGELVGDFDGARPRLLVRGLVIEDADGERAFAADELRAVLSLRALLRGSLRLALLEVDAPVLRVERLAARHLRVAGIDIDFDARGGGDALERLLAHRRVTLRHARIDWHDRVSGESASLRDVDIALGSVGRRHRASLRAPALLDVGSDVNAAIEFYRPAFAPLGDWRGWSGEGYVGAERLDLAALARRWQSWQGAQASAAADALTVDKGQARLRAWLHFERGAVVDGTVKLALDDLEAGADGRRLPLAALSAEAHARRRADGSTIVRVPRLRAEDHHGLAFSALDEGTMLTLAGDGRPLAARLALGNFDAASLSGLATRLPLPAELRRHIEALRVRGIVNRLAIDWSANTVTDATGHDRPRFDVDLTFERLGFERIEPAARAGLRLPAFADLSGHTRFTERGGAASLHGDKAVLRFPGLFEEPEVPLDRFEAQVSWTVGPHAEPQAAPAVDVSIDAVRFANADASGELSGRYRSGGKGVGIVDLRGSLVRADAARTARYLPLALPENVRRWVGQSVVAGRADDVRFVLQGDLADFPFRDAAAGEFRVDARLADATLAYAPRWTPIERIQGRLRFERAGMEIDVRSGQVHGVALSPTKARITEFRDALLTVEGSGEGPAQDMVRFVDDSPLPVRIGHFSGDVAIDGNARLRLALEMPLRDVEATRVRGSVEFAGNHVALDRTLPPLDGVSGRLEFTESGLALRAMSATLLGGPVSVDGDTPAPGRFVLRAQGTLPASGIVELADNPLTRRLAGATAYRADVDVRGRAATLVVTSDLQGLSSDLPAPFGKTAEARWPLRIESRPAAPDAPGERPARDALRVALRDDVKLVFERERDPVSQRLMVRRGAFALADEPTLPEHGFAVLLRTPAVDLDAWNALLGRQLLGPGGEAPVERFSLLPDTVSLVADTVDVAGKTLHDVVLGASRADGYWRANVRAREIDGYFGWGRAAPGQAQGTLVARFTRLEIPRTRIDEFETLLDTTPESLPALDIAAEELILNERRLGALELDAINTGTSAAPVWQLRRLSLRNPAATLSARGTWQTRPGAVRRATAMDFDLRLDDAGALLALFGFADTLRGGAGRLGGQVRWTGSPLRLDYRTLGGELAIDLGKGQFLKSDPGIAKLIGVLNLQSLRRRLAFDFRDVFAEGFAFDRISGHARIDGGVAYTDDFEMRGVAAEVGIRGEANIAAETQALVVQVRPELNAGLASLAYAALANPAIGLGSFVAQLALRQPLQQLFAYEYAVSGSWSDPQVSERSRPPPSGAPPLSEGPAMQEAPSIPGGRPAAR